MADGLIVPSRIGQVEASGDADALFLKVFANEVLTSFEESNVMKNLHTVRTISSGKSAQFPVIGKATAKYHTPGEDVFEATNGTKYPSVIQHNERIINIDDVLIAATSIANIDELKNHYDVRSTYATELGRALAKRFDIATMKTLFGAASAGQENISGVTGTGNRIVIGDESSLSLTGSGTAEQLIDLFTFIAQRLDEKDVPETDRFAIVTPAQYHTLSAANSAAIHKDFGNTGSGSEGTVYKLAGIEIVKSNHLQDIMNLGASQDSDDANANNHPHDTSAPFETGGYNFDATELEMLAGHKSAIGTVKLLDLAVESEYSMSKQSHLMLAKYAMGHGILRPEAAVSVVN
jgi:hypothetical protein|tara:strand:+ start:319 stop:1365 length:1047 start_codon:yes stop_codon:yes gene_type:complete